MKVSEVLTQAKAKIADPKNWIQDHMACDSLGRPVSPAAPHAACWCSLGALVATGADVWARSDAKVLLREAIRAPIVPGSWTSDIAGYNDNHSHAEVMQMWDRAIELAKNQEKHDVL